VQSKGEIALKERRVLKAVRVVAGFEGREVRNAKKKKTMRVEEKSRNSSFGERSLVALSLFQAFAMEKDCVRYRS